MYKAVCSNCGKECQVPFRPTGDKPVYCSDCFEKMGGRRQDSPRPERSENQFDSLNAKLDRILGLLEPKVAEEVEAPKAKKVAKKVTSTKKK